MRRRFSYQLDPLRVWLLLRLRRRCGWRRVCRGRSRSRARQQIPNENQGKDNCRCDDEQPVCVHRVCPGSLWPTTLAPLGALEQVKPSGRTNITWPGGPRSKLKHVTPWSRRTPRALSLRAPVGFVRGAGGSPLLHRTSGQSTPRKEENRIPAAKGGSAQHQFQLRSCDEPGRRDEPSEVMELQEPLLAQAARHLGSSRGGGCSNNC